MHEHEVPTHVQAEDRVLLWFTFPQLIALAVVAALGYGVYHYAPIGSELVRVLMGATVAAVGVAMVAGKIGGRPLPAVLADLLRFGVGARRFEGPVVHLVRSEPPATNEQSARRPRTRGERMPRVPLGWFRKRDRKRPSKRELDEAKQSIRQESRGHRLPWPALLGAVGLVAVLGIGTCTLPITVAQELSLQPTVPEEIEFEPDPLIDGRRLFIERLTVTESEATVVLKAAADLDLNVQTFGGRDGQLLVVNRSVQLAESERTTQVLPLGGERPSFTFSWQDEHHQAGAVTLAGEQLPFPLPNHEGELCDLVISRLEWRPGSLSGEIESDCVDSIDEQVQLQTVSGHHNLSQDLVLTGQGQSVSGAIQVRVGDRTTSATFVADGVTTFELVIGSEEAPLAISVSATLTADIQIALPPLVQLRHVPQRTETFSETVSLTDPESGESVSQTITFQVVHPARVEAEIVQRSPLRKQRSEELTLGTSIAADASYESLNESEPSNTGSTQTVVSGSELTDLLSLLGWELN